MASKVSGSMSTVWLRPAGQSCRPDHSYSNKWGQRFAPGNCDTAAVAIEARPDRTNV